MICKAHLRFFFISHQHLFSLSMRTGNFLFGYRLIQAFRRTLPSSASTVNAVPFRFNFLCTQIPDNSSAEVLESELEGPKSLSSRIEKIPKTESVGYAFRSWMGDGFPIHRGDIFHAINRLRKLERNKRAFEASAVFPLADKLWVPLANLADNGWLIHGELPHPTHNVDFSKSKREVKS